MPTVAEYKSQAEKLERDGQLAKARAVYEHLIKHLEASTAIWKELPLYVKAGDVASQLGDLEGAMRLFERAGERYAELGEVERVIAVCRKVLKEDPEHVSVYRRLAAQLLKHDYVEQARRLMLDLAHQSGRKASIEQLERLAMEPPAEVRAAIEKGFDEAGEAEEAEEAAEAEAAEQEDEVQEAAAALAAQDEVEDAQEAEDEEAEAEVEEPVAEEQLIVRTAADELQADVGGDTEKDAEKYEERETPAPPEPVVARPIEQEVEQEPEEEEAPLDVGEDEGSSVIAEEQEPLALDDALVPEPVAEAPTPVPEPETQLRTEEEEEEEKKEKESEREKAEAEAKPKKRKKRKKRKRVRRRRPASPVVRIAAVVVVAVGASAALFATGVISIDDLPLVGGGGAAGGAPAAVPVTAVDEVDALDVNEYVPVGPEPAPTIALEAFPPMTGRP